MNILIITAIILITFTLLSFFYLKWYVKKRTALSQLDERQVELSQSLKQSGMLIAEIDNITDRDSQLIENRITQLKELLHEVDKRIEIYEKDIERLYSLHERINKNLPKNENLYTNLGRGIRAAFSETEILANLPPASSDLTVNSHNTPRLIDIDPPLSDIPRVNSLVEQPGGALQDTVEASQDTSHNKKSHTPSKKQIRGFIDSLANEGHSPDEIAKQLNISIAEVNLAMNLRRKK